MSEQSMARVGMPTAASVRAQLAHWGDVWRGAMFLKAETYAYERDRKNPFGNGLVYVALVGLFVALAGILGAGMRYATSPTVDAVKNTVLVHLHAMPFYNAFDSSLANQFDQGFEQVWNQFGTIFVGYPTNDSSFILLALSILTTPLGLVVGWIVYGALVHLVARGWNPETSFPELLAPLALATSPQILNVLTLFPNTGVSGVAIALWVFLCNVFAIRVAYQTTTRRAVWGAVFPILVAVVLILIGIMVALVLLRGRSGG